MTRGPFVIEFRMEACVVIVAVTACAWGADPACERTPDPQYDSLLAGHRWCSRCGPLQIERQVIVRAMLDAGLARRLEAALNAVEAEARSTRS